jgi:NAD(P)H-hydrate epimerase
MKILTSEQMQSIDRRATEEFGIPSIVLMENAALGVMDAIFAHYPDADRAAIFCGPGQNGGDGLAIARHFENRGVIPTVILLAEPGKIRGDARTNLEICRSMGLPLKIVSDDDSLGEALALASEADLVVDAIFGSGLSRPLEGLFADAVTGLMSLRLPVIAVDLPTGLYGSRAAVDEPVVQADVTITFAQPKIPHVFSPAAMYCGKVIVADISIPHAAIEAENCQLSLITPEDVRPIIPPRLADTHKGTYGHVAIVAGSQGKSGAAILAARGAVRGGAGLVTVVTDPETAAIVSAASIESMTFPITSHADSAHALQTFLKNITAVAMGPGLPETREGFDRIRQLVRDIDLPLIIDASALNAFEGNIRGTSKAGRTTILTPHPGELARLMGKSTREIQHDRVASARTAARESGCVVVLKGHQTLIAEPDGHVAVNDTGNPAMASGGMGDVLTGVLAAFIGQGMDPYESACAAVYLHGYAADLLRDEKSDTGIRAMEVADKIPEAIQRVRTAK